MLKNGVINMVDEKNKSFEWNTRYTHISNNRHHAWYGICKHLVLNQYKLAFMENNKQ